MNNKHILTNAFIEKHGSTFESGIPIRVALGVKPSTESIDSIIKRMRMMAGMPDS